MKRAAPDPAAAPPPRVRHLFNVFGAPTEQSWLDVVKGTAALGFAAEVACETSGSLAGGAGVPVETVPRIRVEPVDDTDRQMQEIAKRPVPGPLPAVVHGHLGTRVLHAAPYLARGVPALISLYGYDASRLLRDPAWVERYRWAARQGATFVVLAPSLRDRLVQRGVPRGAVEVVPLGIHLDQWPFDPHVASQPSRFVFVGRLTAKKGVATLIDALPRCPGCALHVVGDGPLAGTLRRRCEGLGLGDRVVFRGERPRGELPRILRGATALVLPSETAPDGDEEGTPIVLMEAQALGVPVVTTFHGGNAEVISEAGQAYVAPPGDPAALAETLRAVAALPPDLRAVLQAQGRRWVEDAYDLRQTIVRYAALYRALIRSDPGLG